MDSSQAPPPSSAVAAVTVERRIVIVGGGAGGLVLASKLGRRLETKGKARVTLIDSSLTHVWKPLLHEVAVGTRDSNKDDVIYFGHAKAHRFDFQQGRMIGLDRAKKHLILAPILDSDGTELIPTRLVPYDDLVIAIGGICNDFGTPGVKEHCQFLDTQAEAEQVQRRLLSACLRAHARSGALEPGQLGVVIIGAGATGVELAAEMHKATRQMVAYGIDRIDPERDVKITLIEAAPSVLPALPERLQEATLEQLDRLGVHVLTNTRVIEANTEGIRTDGGQFIPAEIRVWSAGVKAPDFLSELDGLATNRSNQLIVDRYLRTTRDSNIYAIGDCAQCPDQDGKPVPPRAQAAYQQALTLARNLARASGQAEQPFVYRDYGSLISLSYSTIGSLMGNLLGSVTIEGKIAQLTYRLLYKKHQLALHGWLWVALTSLINLIRLKTEPRLKLH